MSGTMVATEEKPERCGNTLRRGTDRSNLPMLPHPITPEEIQTFSSRFWRYVQKSDTACWIWTGYRNQKGYGRLYIRGHYVAAHRFAYTAALGPIADGLQIDHLCRVRNCVNPAHLEAVSCQTNLLRGKTLAARSAAATHCPQGHPYSDENTYHSPKGFRFCRRCGAAAARQRRKQRKSS